MFFSPQIDGSITCLHDYATYAIWGLKIIWYKGRGEGINNNSKRSDYKNDLPKPPRVYDNTSFID